MIKNLFIVALCVFTLGSIAYAATPVFNSSQVGSTPQNGYYLKTDGTSSTWAAVSASVSGTISTSSPLTAGLLVQSTAWNTIANIATSSLKLTTSSFASPNVSQWTNNAGYLTSLAGAASSTLLADINTWTNTQTMSITGLAGTATALASNPTNCTAGNYPLGIDASGNVENCTAAAVGTVTAVTATSPLFSSGGATPNITWAGLATTSQPSSSNLLVSNGGAGVFGVATGTVSAGSSAVTVTAGRSVIGGALAIDCATAGSGQNGCLSSTNWSTFNSKQATISATYPIILTGAALSFPATSTLYGTGTPGQVLMWSGSTPIWAATSTASQVYPGAGIALSTGSAWGTSITDNSTNWNTAYTSRISSASFPLSISANAISFGGLATSSAISAASGLLYATGVNTLASVSTSTAVNMSISGNAATVTTNANLSGVVTSSGNTTSFGSQTAGVLGNAATGNTGVMSTTTLYGTLGTPGYVLMSSGGKAVWSATSTASGVTSVTATAPIFSSGGLTPNITWAGLATTSQPAIGNLLVSNGAAGVFGVATGTISNGTNITVTNGSTAKVIGAGITISLSGQVANTLGGTGLDTSAWNGLAAINAGVWSQQATSSISFGNASTTQFSSGTNTFYINSTGKVQAKDVTSGYSGVISPIRNPSFSYATTTTWTATSSVNAMSTVAPYAGTIKTARCMTDAGTLNVDIYHTTTHLALLNASTTVGVFSFTSNNTFTAGEKIYAVMGTPASSPTVGSCTLDVTITP